MSILRKALDLIRMGDIERTNQKAGKQTSAAFREGHTRAAKAYDAARKQQGKKKK